MRALLALSVVSLVSLAAAPAEACSCAEVGLEQAIAGADAIFEGVVDSIEVDASADVRVVRFAVTQAWRGVMTERIEVRTHVSEAACGYTFEIGRAYLVYASGPSASAYQVSLCSRTRPMDTAGEDRSALGSGVVPVDIVDEDIEPVRAARTAPSRAGCASCTVGAAPGSLASAVAGLSITLAALRARRRRCSRA